MLLKPHLPVGFLSSIRTVCTSHPVTLAYLFGSQARGKADRESDTDIAVLLDEGFSREERWKLRMKLQHSLADALHIPFEEVDVVILQDVPVLLQYNVIRTGVPVFEARPGLQRDFALQVERSYDDELPLLERETDLALSRILTSHQ
jgi:hypothetical protein